MKTIKFLVFILLYISCSTNKNIDKFDIDEEGVVVEKANITKQYDEVYNSNNLIYNVGKKFRYTYFYQNLKGEKFLIKRGKPILQPEGYSINDWEFIDIEKIDNETVNQIILKPNYGNSFQNEIPDYNQTVISYEYLLLSGESFVMEKTGVIENEKNIWMHPPRSYFFEILELNPFPYIKAPFKIGTKWNWKLKIGDYWSDKRWLEWNGEIENVYDYEIKKNKIISTKLGDLECFIVNATAKSRIGLTGLISYFNPKYGFVKLEYNNIDGTKTVLELENIE
jgi:hypothetical protein